MHRHPRVNGGQHCALPLRNGKLPLNQRIGKERPINASSSAFIPSPVRAETSTSPLAMLRSSSPVRSPSPSRSILFSTSIRGLPSVPLGQHLLHLRLLLLAIGRCGVPHMQQHFSLLHLLERGAKLVTSVCGRLRMKPTVSLSNTLRRLGSSTAFSLGSRRVVVQALAIVGGSATLGCRLPEDVDVPGITVLDRNLRFDTPFGQSQPFKLLRFDGAHSGDGRIMRRWRSASMAGGPARTGR